MSTFRNPVLTGCHPDPSVCRVGGDFYLVTSSFTYFPAIPVFHSRDLVNWRPLGHVLERSGAVSLLGLETSDGIWAPTIRHHNGVFYVVSTVARNRQGSINFIAVATDPAGPWSEPIALDADGIDPSLFFDDDGRCWFTACRDAQHPVASGPGELWMRELNLTTLRLEGATHVLWHGAMRGAWVEAPHIYKRDGVYHLIAAEGGTERHHAVTSARSAAVTGPYLTDPRSPLLSHRHLGPAAPIQNVGHADIVDTDKGDSWAVVLGTRPVDGTHTLGREVFLVPVSWTPDGPVFAPDVGVVRELGIAPSLTESAPQKPLSPVRESFGYGSRSAGWRSLRGPIDSAIRQSPTGSGLSLSLTPETLSGVSTPTVLLRRQQHLVFQATAPVTFSPATADEEAGLVVFQNQDHFATLTVTLDSAGRRAVRLFVGSNDGPRTRSLPVEDGEVLLRMSGDDTSYNFEFRAAHATQWEQLGYVERSLFSSEQAGGFVGVHLGVYASSNGHPSTAEARIRWFEYRATSLLEESVSKDRPSELVV